MHTLDTTRFSLGWVAFDDQKPTPAWIQHERWNGFACPAVTREGAEALFSLPNNFVWDGDIFRVNSYPEEYTIEQVLQNMKDVEAGTASEEAWLTDIDPSELDGVKLYAFGFAGYTFNDLTEEQEALGYVLEWDGGFKVTAPTDTEFRVYGENWGRTGSRGKPVLCGSFPIWEEANARRDELMAGLAVIQPIDDRTYYYVVEEKK